MQSKLKGAALGCVALSLLFTLLCRSGAGVWYGLAITFGTISYHPVMRLAVGFVFDVCMKNRADYRKAWFQPWGFEPGLMSSCG